MYGAGHCAIAQDLCTWWFDLCMHPSFCRVVSGSDHSLVLMIIQALLFTLNKIVVKPQVVSNTSRLKNQVLLLECWPLIGIGGQRRDISTLLPHIQVIAPTPEEVMSKKQETSRVFKFERMCTYWCLLAYVCTIVTYASVACLYYCCSLRQERVSFAIKLFRIKHVRYTTHSAYMNTMRTCLGVR